MKAEAKVDQGWHSEVICGYHGDHMKRKQPQIKEIGIRELKARTSALVRSVKEERARYVITQRGRPVAQIVPLDSTPPERPGDETWDRLFYAGEELSRESKDTKKAVEILSEIRR